MTGERVERRLAAVLAADVAGYSRLMGINEEGTLARLKEVRKAFVDPIIANHRGRIVKTTGDGMLVEFASAVDAVRGAVEVQRVMDQQNADVPQDERIEFRIGIHVGDIIIDDTDIFGDGVNVAARLEGIAEPGGVCMSNDAYRQVRAKVEIACDDMGPQPLKNIAEPVQAWKIRLTGQNPSTIKSALAARSPPAFALPDKPSIAVLPFQNMSGDPEQEYFADGIVEDIITALSHSRELFVSARNSSFAYKGQVVDLKKVSRELGVRYVLEGSVRRAGNRLRITAQLIEASTGSHLWAQRYDGDLTDIFNLQDEITHQVAAAILPTVESSERERAARKPLEALGAWEYYHRGLFHFFKFEQSENEEAKAMFGRALAFDPAFALAHSRLAFTYYWEGFIFSPEARPVVVPLGLKHSQQCIALDSKETTWHLAMGLGLTMLGRHDEGLRFVDDSLASNPNYAWAHGIRGAILTFSGRGPEGLESIHKAVRLSPFDPMRYNWIFWEGRNQFWSGDYEASLATGRRLCQLRPDIHLGYRITLAALGELGRLEEAREIIREAISRFGEPLRESMRTRIPEIRPQDFEKLINAYRKAGFF